MKHQCTAQATSFMQRVYRSCRAYTNQRGVEWGYVQFSRPLYYLVAGAGWGAEDGSGLEGGAAGSVVVLRPVTTDFG